MPFNETYNTSFAPYTENPTDMEFWNNKRRALEGLLWFPENAIKAIDPATAQRHYHTGMKGLHHQSAHYKCPLGQACLQMVTQMGGSDLPKNEQYRATVSEIMDSNKPPPAAIQTVLNTYYKEFSQTEYIPRTHSLAGKYLLGEELPEGLSKERYDDLEAFTIYWDDGKITRKELATAIRKRLENETTYKFTVGI